MNYSYIMFNVYIPIYNINVLKKRYKWCTYHVCIEFYFIIIIIKLYAFFLLGKAYNNIIYINVIIYIYIVY